MVAILPIVPMVPIDPVVVGLIVSGRLGSVALNPGPTTVIPALGSSKTVLQGSPRISRSWHWNAWVGLAHADNWGLYAWMMSYS
jgi:hypothetical protein